MGLKKPRILILIMKLGLILFSGANTEAIKELAIKGTEVLKDKTEQIKDKINK